MVVDAEVAAWVTQFGVAGLVCWMWLVERRASAQRERELREAHGKLMRERETGRAMLDALNDNTRALTSLEACQRGLTEVIGAWGREDRQQARGSGR